MHSSKPNWQPPTSGDPAPPARIIPADVDAPPVAEVLFAAIGGDRSRLTAACEFYRNDCDAVLLALIMHGRPIGVAGYKLDHAGITLRHIATIEPHRLTGAGRRLLAEIRSRHPDSDLVAETDAESLGFYLATGFAATSLGEKYPGVERFRVHLSRCSPDCSPAHPAYIPRNESPPDGDRVARPARGGPGEGGRGQRAEDRTGGCTN